MSSKIIPNNDDQNLERLKNSHPPPACPLLHEPTLSFCSLCTQLKGPHMLKPTANVQSSIYLTVFGTNDKLTFQNPSCPWLAEYHSFLALLPIWLFLLLHFLIPTHLSNPKCHRVLYPQNPFLLCLHSVSR